ncbi:MAG: EAL domain-containing protein, partial [Clostridia bacterium]|nr:EAL domain-containing protein [Clostridia bacterium]
MNYILYFDYAGICVIAAVMFSFFYRQTIKTRSTQFFIAFMLVALCTVILDIVSTEVLKYVQQLPLWVSYIPQILYLSLLVANPVIYLLYTLSVVRDKKVIKKWIYVAVLIPFGLQILFVLISPFIKGAGIFWFTENREYVHGPLLYVQYAITFAYILGSLIYVFFRRKAFTLIQEITIYLYIVINIICVILQMVMPELLIQQFGITIAVMLIYMSLQNPEDYMDKRQGAFNALAFETVFSGSAIRGKKFGVLGVRINGLRYIGDTLGEESENEILREIVQFLIREAGKKRVFVLSQTKYAIILNEGEDFKNLADVIYNRFSQPFSSNGAKISLGVDTCFVQCPEVAAQLKDVFSIFDICLDEKSITEHNDTVIARKEILEKGHRETRILQAMRQGLKDNGFEVFYQPIYSVEKKRLASAEALIRMKDVGLGFISPDEFIPLAEKNGLILDIGEFVFRDVCRFINERKLWDMGIENIHVNLSVVQCMQESLHEVLISIMDEYHIDYSMIHLEMTESAAVASEETLKSNMHKLIEKGMSFALDDYGTGFSNTVTMMKYPF